MVSVIINPHMLQVRYAVREYACTAIDIMARRTRLAFCNANAAAESLPRVVDIMAEELKWSKTQKKVRDFLDINQYDLK